MLQHKKNQDSLYSFGLTRSRQTSPQPNPKESYSPFRQDSKYLRNTSVGNITQAAAHPYQSKQTTGGVAHDYSFKQLLTTTKQNREVALPTYTQSRTDKIEVKNSTSPYYQPPGKDLSNLLRENSARRLDTTNTGAGSLTYNPTVEDISRKYGIRCAFLTKSRPDSGLKQRSYQKPKEATAYEKYQRPIVQNTQQSKTNYKAEVILTEPSSLSRNQSASSIRAQRLQEELKNVKAQEQLFTEKRNKIINDFKKDPIALGNKVSFNCEGEATVSQETRGALESINILNEKINEKINRLLNTRRQNFY